MWTSSRALVASLVLLVGSLIAGVATPAHAAATDLYYERALAVAAQDRCGLFEPQVASALGAATLQARGAALRSGAEVNTLVAAAARARAQVGALACTDSQVRQMASRVRSGFEGWSRAGRISFPGLRSGWQGDRFRSKSEGWRLAQDGVAGRSPVRFGLVGKSPSATRPASVVSFVGKNRPYAARLVMRNQATLPRPWLAGDRMPPVPARASYFATRTRAAERALLSEGQRQGEHWSFPEAAIEALARLDPRESFQIEFLFRDDSVAVARFEVGDFAAGRAFLEMGPL